MKYIIAVCIIVACLGLYLNRAYAHIFSTIGSGNLPLPKTTDLVFNPVQKTNTTTLTYVALGDSLTAGVGTDNASTTFPALLATHIADQNNRPVRLLDLGIPGATVAGVIDNELPIARTASPDLVTILVGTNDMFSRVPLPRFQNNVTALLTQLSGVKKVILFTIPELGASSTMLPPYRAYFAQQIGAYNNAIRGAGSGFSNVTIIDLHALQDRYPAPANFYAADGFHPSSAGYTYWSTIIYANTRF